MRSRNDAADLGRGRPPIVPDRASEKPNFGKRKRADLEADNLGNAKLQEYLEVMQPPSRSMIWANEYSTDTRATNTCAPSLPLQVVDEGKNDKDYDNMSKKPTKSRMVEEPGGNLPLYSKSTSTADVFTDIEPIADESKQLPVRVHPPSSDEDWLRSRTSRLLDLVEDESAPVSRVELALAEEKEAERTFISKTSMNKTIKDPSVQADEETNSGSFLSVTPLNPRNESSHTSGRLFVRNLPYTATEEDLRRYFESDGNNSIIEVSLAESLRSD